jgi:hypothetical protein
MSALSEPGFINSGNLHQVPQQPDLEQAISMYGHRNASRIARLGLQVMTALRPS